VDRARICKLQKGCTRLTATTDQVYQLLAMVGGSLRVLRLLTTLKLVAIILLNVVLSAINQIIKSSEVERSTNRYIKPTVVLSRGFVLYVIYSLFGP
jgi:hypothetical protein